MDETEINEYLVKEALETPIDWSTGGHVHNWRNYVGQHVRALWATLPDEVKVAIAHDADDRAGYEDWE